VQRLLDKQNQGDTLSSNEQKSIDDWQEQQVEDLQQELFKAVQSSPAAAEAMDQAGVFACPKGQPPTPAVAAPTRPQFENLLDQLKREYGKLAGDRLSAVNTALVSAKADAAGTNLALPLTLAGNAPAAVFATVWSCARKPDNATFASNLGSLLDGVGDARAGAVLAYALALGPSNILPNANQGWYLFNRGQLAQAKASFEKAAERGPDLGPVLLGQGLVAHCQDDHRRAVDLLTRALSVASSRAGEQALSTSRAREADHENQDQNDTDPDAVPTPRREDWTKDVRKPHVVFAEPVVPATNDELVTVGAKKNGEIVEGYRREGEALIAGQQALNPNAGGDRAPTLTATSVTYYRGDDAMAALARAQYTAYAARIRAVRAPFERDFNDQRERVVKQVAAIFEAAVAAGPANGPQLFCKNARSVLNSEYGKYKASWGGTWEAEQKVIREYGEVAFATISRIRHDDLREYVDSERKLHLGVMAMDGPGDIIAWGATVGAGILSCTIPVPEVPAVKVAPQEAADNAPCPQFLQNGIGVSLGVASVSMDCEKIAVQAGEGLIGRFEQNYVKHEQTYYLGVGLEATAGVGPVSAGAGGSAGVFITCSGNRVRDIGVQGSSSAMVPGLSMEASGTAAAVSGPSGSFSAGVAFSEI
jgi:tetratricopeptide (TPR) repeat protein